ncbi:MAG: cation:dicarboxylate symporter family transporter [Anaplasma sp.]
MFSKQSLRFAFLAATALLSFIFADLVPYDLRSFSYAVSLSIKEVLVFVLPFIVFSIVYRSVNRLQSSNAIKIVATLIVMVILLNAVAISSAYFVGMSIASADSGTVVHGEAHSDGGLVPSYVIHLPPLVSSVKAVIVGFLCGLALPKIRVWRSSKALADILAGISTFFLEKIFVPIMPIFIVGLVFKMQSDNLTDVLQSNAEMVFYMLVAISVYLLLLYGMGASFVPGKIFHRIKNMLPATLLGFTTMSSLVTMPLVIQSAKKDLKNPNIIDMVVPAVINIHMLGDCFFIIVTSLVISGMFGTLAHVTALDAIFFMLSFLASMFAIVGVPGGGVIVMLPIIERYLHFSPTMSSLITTLYVLFDPMITSVNLLGNGAFALLFARIHQFLFVKKGKRR